MKYKIIFSDMDHTLLNSHLEISEKNENAIKKLIRLKIPFILCTGRGIYGVEPYIKQLNLTSGYVITQNGGAVYRLPELDLEEIRSFSAEDIFVALKGAKELGIDIQLYYDRILMAEHLSPRIALYSKTMGIDITLIPNVLDYKGRLTKCLFNSSIEKLSLLREKVMQSLEGKVNMCFSNKEYWEITALEATKGNAMMDLANKFGICAEEIIAIGDSENDISMLEAAGLGIAVANALENVKNKANIVLQTSENEDAVAQVIEECFFI